MKVNLSIGIFITIVLAILAAGFLSGWFGQKMNADKKNKNGKVSNGATETTALATDLAA